MTSVRSRLGAITQPVMIVHGGLDTTVVAAQMNALAGALTNAARITRLDLPASAHLLAIDRDRDRLAQEAIAFLRE